MAETIAYDVVNGNQSMGAKPAPIDAPEETQSSSRAAEEVGDVQVQSNVSHNRHSQDKSETPATFRTRDMQADAEQVNAPATTSEEPQQVAENSANTDEGLNASVMPNGNTSADTFPEPSPLAVDNAELEWRRPLSENQPSFGRTERSNSIKKPTSFKSVSVSKNFLAKSTTGGTMNNKAIPDKTSSPSPAPSSTSLAAKPRLVAKSVRDVRVAPLAGQAASSGPDASKVWNRNRPVPPAPPKQFTDEELKQQYGIHLATRLQSDEPDKGSKWADMEDDEDDWAPDTVEWMDGTKTTLQQENQPPQPPVPEQSPQKQDVKPDEMLSESSQPPASSIGPGKTILRPGARASQSITRPGLVLRSVPEDQSPAPKPTANGLSKSPWAQLPPVDKVSPVTFYPPAPSQAPSHLRRDSSAAASAAGSAIDSNLPTPSPAREIAADTFDRTWRAHERGSRELFDAKSGRYEPARGGRRSSFRQEGGFRPPSVLQRPTHLEQDAGYASQDARNSERRPSTLSAEDPVRPERKSSDGADGSTSERATSPLVARGDTSPTQPAPPGASQPDTSSDSRRPYSAHPVGDTATSPHVDGPSSDVQLQHQLMRQRIEANRRRKQEEQALEEAAKQERIREKLKALDKTAPVTSPREPKPQPADVEQLGTISARQQPPATDPIPSDSSVAVSIPTVITDKDLGPTSTSSSKFEDQPHLDGLGEGPTVASTVFTPLNQAPGAYAQPPATSFPRQGPAPVKSSPASHPDNFAPSVSLPTSTADNISKFTNDQASTAHLVSSDNRIFPHSQASTPQPFERSPQHHWASAHPSNTSTGWSSTSGAPSHLTPGNVWGPPSSDKALGNGSFDTDFHHRHHFPHYPHSFRQSPQLQPPIAPPSISPRPSQSPQPDHPSKSTFEMSHTQVAPSPTAASFTLKGDLNNDAPSAPPKKWQGFIPGLDYRRPTAKGQNGQNGNKHANQGTDNRAIFDAIRGAHADTVRGGTIQSVNHSANERAGTMANRPSVPAAPMTDGNRWQLGSQTIQDNESALREKAKQDRNVMFSKPIEADNIHAAVTFKKTSRVATESNERLIVQTNVSEGTKPDDAHILPTDVTAIVAAPAGGIHQPTANRQTSRFFPAAEPTQQHVAPLAPVSESISTSVDMLGENTVHYDYPQLPSPEDEDALFDKQDPLVSSYPSLNIPGSGCILIPIRKTPPPQYVCVKLPDAVSEATRSPQHATAKSMPLDSEPTVQFVQSKSGHSFSRGPGYNGAPRIVDTLDWQHRMAKEGRPMNMDELKEFYESNHPKNTPQDSGAVPATPKSASAELAASRKALSPDTLSKSPEQRVVAAKPLSEGDRTMIVVPGQIAISGSKADDVTETKSLDGSVFAEPENGSRPAITLAKDVPEVDEPRRTISPISQQSSVGKPDVRSVSPLTLSDLQARVKITASFNGKYGGPSKKPVNGPAQPMRKPTTTNNSFKPGSRSNSNLSTNQGAPNVNFGNSNAKTTTTAAAPVRRVKNDWARPARGTTPPERKNW